MIKIQEFKKNNFKTTWKLLNIGFKGSDIFANQLYSNDILEYAIEKLETDECDDLVCELASEYANNTEGIDSLLKQLSRKEDTDESLELRKWRVVIVAQEITNKKDNCINGLMSLGDLWISMGYPEDSPHIFQGRENSITPEQYYTDENYCKIFEQHIAWLKKEIEFIHNNQG